MARALCRVARRQTRQLRRYLCAAALLPAAGVVPGLAPRGLAAQADTLRSAAPARLLTSGVRVRLSVPGAWPDGYLVGTLAYRDTAVVAVATKHRTWFIKYDALGDVEVSRPQRPWGAAARGALVGAAIGVIVLHTTGAPPLSDRPPGISSRVATTRGLAAGAVVGALAGAVFGRKRWERVPLTSLSPP
jgi:hypothetical protein